MKKLLLLIINLFLLLNYSLAQDCGTTISEEESIQLEKLLQSNETSSRRLVANDAVVNIPLKFHLFRRTDGSGGLNQSQIDNLIAQVNDYYINANMLFFQEGDINYIDDDDIYDFNADSEGDATVGNTVTNVVNVYLFNSIQLSGSPLCGYTRFPPSADRVFAVYSCVTNGNTTLEHELGHYFTLYHTHGTTNTGTTDELVNQSNCRSAGDRLCDTPADPNLSGQVDSNCAYIGGATDANGDIYKPDPSNIMSYAPDRCADKFSRDQYDRIRTGFENGRSNLRFTSESFIATINADLKEVCVGESTKFSVKAFGATEYNWTFEGGEPSTSKSENPQVTYNSPGSFKVILNVSNSAGQSLVVEQTNYIRVKDPSLNAISGILEENFSNNSNFSSRFIIENPDNSLTFEQKSLSLDDKSTNLLFVNNFDYNSEALPQIDVLKTVSFENTGARKYFIEFEYAYNNKTIGSGLSSQTINDSLQIEVGNECVGQYDVIFKDGGSSFVTTDQSSSIAFEPNQSNEFKTVVREYIPSSESDYLQFKIKNISYNGNNLYIKNIKITPDYSLVPPSNFRYVGIENDSIIFRWLDNSINEMGFILEASEDEVNFTDFASISSNRQLFKFSIDEVNDYRYFRLKAIGVNDFESDYSTILRIDNSILSNTDIFEDEIFIYPNPVKNSFYVELNSTHLNKPVQYQIISLNGNVILDGFLNQVNNYIDISNIEEGIYYINIINSNQSNIKSKKIIKL